MNYQKVRDHCHYAGKYRGAAHSICNLKINGSNYDYHFIIKEYENEFEGQFKCRNTKKYKIQKSTKNSNTFR